MKSSAAAVAERDQPQVRGVGRTEQLLVDQVGVRGPEAEVVELVPEVAAAPQEVEVVALSPAAKAAIRSAATRVTGYSRAVGVNSG